MKLTNQLFITYLIGLLSLIGFTCMAMAISRHDVLQFDQTIISFIQGAESPMLTQLMIFFTEMGSFPAVLSICIVALFFLYFVLKYRGELILFAAVMIGTSILNYVLKLIFHRIRPDFHRLIEIGGYSFPSGHAMNAFALYGILTFLLWRHIPNRLGRASLILVSIIFILMIGISRIYLGVHYPSDIIGGYFSSAFLLALFIRTFKKSERESLCKKRCYYSE
ncbi:phosphatase PAP2 family protein [Caldibacillus lycopersici]|uniref:Phosphatase PAP2 family protein n=1 Tax=Perspicuibacillus lycopersici TaxID=1325689 RepID=A0AAE3IRH6_9BACI|nr:phosphatase PAP2 family protein [Perspicuibacillus lycopersici]MCU9613253.1 phosphatase PAP2 family protein [Perspicuibacillus lycopersici]